MDRNEGIVDVHAVSDSISMKMRQRWVSKMKLNVRDYIKDLCGAVLLDKHRPGLVSHHVKVVGAQVLVGTGEVAAS